MQGNNSSSSLRPPAVFSTLVAGHRATRLQRHWYQQSSLPARKRALAHSLQHVLDVLRSSAADAFAQAGGGLQGSESPEYRLLTGNADGTDELARQLAEPSGYALQVISARNSKPPEGGQYLSLGMTAQESARELDQDAYSLRDTLAVSFADVLVAVWDDREPAEIRSGTARLIRTALLQRKPAIVLQLRADQSQPLLLLTDLKQLTDARLQELETLGHHSHLLLDCFVPCSQPSALSEHCRDWMSLLLTPFASAQDVNNTEVRLRQRIRAQRSVLGYSKQWLRYWFCRDTRPLPLQQWLQGVWLWFSLMLRPQQPSAAWQLLTLMEDREPRTNRADALLHHLHRLASALLRLDRKGLLAALRPDRVEARQAQTTDHLPIDSTRLSQSFQRADRIARVYARRRLDHSWAIFVAAALAVFCAVAGSLQLWPANQSGFWLFWGIGEFFLLRYIIGHVLQLRHRDWHGHWLRYRFIAEQIRYLLIGYPLLVLPKTFQQPYWTVKTSKGTSRCELVSAELWLLQRLMIAAGLPGITAGCNQVEHSHYVMTEHTPQALRYFHSALEEHRTYFANSYHRLHHDHEFLHRMAMLLFGTTFLAVSLHFFVKISWILLFTAFLPAWGAAIHGILTQNELVRMSAMAGTVWQQLDTLHEACTLHARSLRANSHDPSAWEQTRDLRLLVQTLTRVLADENQHWRSLLQHNDPELPG